MINDSKSISGIMHRAKYCGVITLVLVVLSLGLTGCQSKEGATDLDKVQGLGDGVFASISTSKGDIIVSLEFQKTPLTVSSFVGLAEGSLTNVTVRKGQPFFNGLTFHRVEKGFVIQGGDPSGDGTGGPGYQFPNEIVDGLAYDKPGILGMANAGANTNGSQFFITLAATPSLTGRYTVFGHVVKGMEVVNTIAVGDVMQSVKIIRVGKDAEAFKGDQADFDSFQAIVKNKIEADNQALAGSEEAAKKLLPNASKTTSGIYYVIDKKGTGAAMATGKTAVIHYVGTFLNGQVFDSSRARNQPFETVIGQGRVIEGWDETVLSMKVGERRRVIIPPALGYGTRGASGVIPPNAWLFFDIELLSIK